MEQIVIEGDTTKLLEVRVTRIVKTKDWKDSLRSSLGVSTPLLPYGTVMYHQEGQTKIMLLERRPGIKTIRFQAEGEQRDRDTSQRFNLAFPYHYFIATFHNNAFSGLRLFFANKPLEGMDEKLRSVPLSNMNSGGLICLGYRDGMSGRMNMRQRANHVIDHFYESRFNADLDGYYREHQPPEIMEKIAADDIKGYTDRLEAWQRLTKEGADPCTFRWEECSKTIGDLLGMEIEE